MPLRIALLDDYQDVARSAAPWDDLGDDAEVVAFHDHLADDDAVVERLSPFDVVVAMRERTPFTQERLVRLPHLKLLVTTGMGNAAIDLEAAARHGVTVTGTRGLAAPTAELTWALILAVARAVPAEDRSIRDGGWQHTVGTDLEGATLGVIGLGRLGARVAAIGRAFGMDVLAWSQNLTPGHAAEHGAEAVTKEELLRRADVVSIHVRLSPRTTGLIGAAELAAMKPTAILVNTSRGPVVEEAALLDALRRGAIAGAGLDVYDTEPLPAEHPLRSAPRAVLTPHLGYVTRGTYAVFYADALEDVAAWRRGEPVRVLAP